MSKVYSPPVLAMAAANGIAEDELPLIINGCSGGLSWVYGLVGREISCIDCCDMHDLQYQLGGTAIARREADKELRACAACAGHFPPGWKGRVRRVWRRCRAQIMYVAVRLFGGRYWAGQP